MTLTSFVVNTETFHAQYRVLEAFSFFNIILLWAFLILLLFLAVRHHRWGHKDVWISSVTAFPWFAGADAQTGKLPALPAPVSAKRSQSTRSQPQLQRSYSEQVYAKEAYADKAYGDNIYVDKAYEKRPPGLQTKRPSQSSRGSRDRDHRRRPSATRRDTPTKNEAPTYVYMIPHTQPEPHRAGETARQVRDKYLRDASPRR